MIIFEIFFLSVRRACGRVGACSQAIYYFSLFPRRQRVDNGKRGLQTPKPSNPVREKKREEVNWSVNPGTRSGERLFAVFPFLPAYTRARRRE